MTEGINYANIAFDSANYQLIPSWAQIVFPYGDGRYKWSNTSFPNAKWRYYTVFGNPSLDILDWEPGCVFNPNTLRTWATTRIADGLDCTVYCSRDYVSDVANILHGLEWHLGLATLNGTQLSEYNGLPVRYCQYSNRGGLYDTSIVYDTAWLMPAPGTAEPTPAILNVDVVKWTEPSPWNSTMSGIAAHYGISLEALFEANPQVNKKTALIYPGEVIRVP